jgi:acyl-CoA reductase-like NAD-dependent aldehyde dehydrogenase
MGSIISSTHLERIEQMVKDRGKSTRILAGGDRLTGKSSLDDFDFSRGSFYPPTVITDVQTQEDLWREEVFGPVVVVKRFTVSKQ